jgi:hypothetical protein
MLPGQAQLPMWLLSLFFVYEPVNSVLELHQPPVSLCHNLQVFENLFMLSICGAVLGAVRHCFGRRPLLAVAALLCAIAIRNEPRWHMQASTEDEDRSRDAVLYSTLQMLPAAVTTALLSTEVSHLSLE